MCWDTTRPSSGAAFVLRQLVPAQKAPVSLCDEYAGPAALTSEDFEVTLFSLPPQGVGLGKEGAERARWCALQPDSRTEPPGPSAAAATGLLEPSGVHYSSTFPADEFSGQGRVWEGPSSRCALLSGSVQAQGFGVVLGSAARQDQASLLLAPSRSLVRVRGEMGPGLRHLS